jgi:RNA polymerase I-specific transcription initiation factor RRN6
MTDDSPNDLNTGHFGIPAYDRDNSRWAFVRTSTGASFKQLDQWRTVVPAAIRFRPPRAPQTLRAARQVTKSITRDIPELVPATEQVSELEAVSAAATAALETYDASVGQLMSFGTITPLSNRAHLARDLVALPAGEGGNILRLQLLSKEKRGWGPGAISDSLCHLDCLSWKGDHGFWNQDATAIQQVCFAQSEKPGSFLAIRLPQRVALFRPALRQRPAAAAKSRLYDLPPSAIDIHPFHSIWTGDTGNTPHADVAFNPHYQRQFAVIDQKSKWSVWDIDGTQRSYVVKLAASGIMTNEENDNEEQTEGIESRQDDGWARAIWVGDANTLLVCNRKRIELIDLRRLTRSLHVPQVIDERSAKTAFRPWILDVKRHPLLDEKQFFVLTSSRLYLLSATSDELRGTFDNTDASIVLSWTHFRGTEDVTLQLYTQSISDEGMLVPRPILYTY